MRSFISLRLSRPLLASMLIWAVACNMAVAAAQARALAKPAADPRDISGVWWIKSYAKTYQPVGGGKLPFTAKGLALYRQNLAGLKEGRIVDIARQRCVVDGVPRVLGSPYPIQIVQTPGYTTVLYEINHTFRVIPMDVPQNEDPIPALLGNSVAHWDGDTLVIDTVGFKDSLFIDDSGVPVSEKLHVVERMRRLNGGTQLENVFTVEDADLFTQPWSARIVYEWRPDVRLMEYFCGDPHRDVSRLKGRK